MALVVTLLLQLCALVWGAATVSASVSVLQTAANRTTFILDKIVTEQADHDARIRVLESEAKK